jgi:restriction system protein
MAQVQPAQSQPRIFLARAGANGEDEDLALENGLAIICFKEIPSLEGLKEYDDFLAHVRSAEPEWKPRKIGNIAGQLWAFASALEEGDIVVLPRKMTSQIALGIVTGPYRFADVGGHRRHTRAVKWIRQDLPRTAFHQDLLYSFGAFLTVCNISRNDAERRVKEVLNGKTDPGLSSSDPHAKQLNASLNNEETTLDLGQLAHDQIVAIFNLVIRGTGSQSSLTRFFEQTGGL